MPSNAMAYKAAVFTACQTLFPSPALVSYGFPASLDPDNIVAVEGVRKLHDHDLLGTNRTTWEMLEVDLLFSCWSGGTNQQAVTERAYGMVQQLETYLQDSGRVPSSQVTLNGAVVFAQITSTTLAESDDSAVLAKGRVAEIAVTITAKAKY